MAFDAQDGPTPPTPGESNAPKFAAPTEPAPGLDASPETELWNGRAHWKHFAIPLGGVWAYAVTILVFGLILRGMAPSLQSDWFGWLLTLCILLPILYVHGMVVFQHYHVGYRLTTQRLFIERGILSKVVDQTELIRVDDVRVRQSLVNRIWNLGTVEVIAKSDETHGAIAVTGIEDPHRVADQIRERTRELRRKSLFVEQM
jgi:uncharacterized membrane protein YdbT with pleckstrin-like domain